MRLHGASRQAPSAAHWLGTDRVGYDVLSRTIYGAPTALAVGLGAMAIASAIGIVVGGIAGYLGGVVDEVLMRATEFQLAQDARFRRKQFLPVRLTQAPQQDRVLLRKAGVLEPGLAVGQ